MSAYMMHEESDDSSVDDSAAHILAMPLGMQPTQGLANKNGNKPWVPAIEDPNYFEDLLPEEIYDSFFTIRRMGFIANRIIRKLNETKHIVSSKILEKRKKLKALQRKQFEQLSPAGVEYLKVLLKMEIAALKNNAQAVEAGLSPSPNVKARLAHLAADANASEILNKIYATDSSVRTLDFWKYLANEFVNNPSWIPRRVVDDRLYDVDPGYAPEEKISPEALRSVFSRLRIEYTKALLKFHSAPKASLTPEGLDVEFWERYAKHDKGLYYVYLLFKGRSEQDCLMVDSALSRTDFELEHVLSAYQNGGNGVEGGSSLGMKRDHAAMLASATGLALAAAHEDEMLMMVDAEHHLPGALSGMLGAASHVGVPAGAGGAPVGPGGLQLVGEETAWQAQVRKDRAISNYYKRLSINADVRFYLDLLNKETTGEAMKRNIRNKINNLLLKKVEDRYDDLNF